MGQQSGVDSGTSLDQSAFLLYWLAALVPLTLVLFYPGVIPGWVLAGLVLSLLFMARVLHIRSNKRAVTRAAELAYRDTLTGLPNRRRFMEQLEAALARNEQSDAMTVVMFMDLDHFKVVNDTLGHSAGDHFLTAVGARVADCIGERGLVARLGGDEFTVLLEEVRSHAEAVAHARAVLEAIEPSIELEGQELWPRASVGMAFGFGGVTHPEELLSMADVALYRAKQRGRGQFFIFEPNTPLPSTQRLSLETELRTAVQNGELCLVYQPEVDLNTLRIMGMEALVRWRHERLGLLQPDDFIPLAEETGLIRDIGKWVLKAASNQARLWRDLYDHPISVNVNLSALEFREKGLLKTIRDTLLEANVARDTIGIEITETALMEDQDSTIQTLEELRRMGVRVAIDDFGVGYSSLSYLKRFKVDVLKLDRSFVRDAEDPRTLSIIESVVSLAHALDMKITAEGIETMEQLRSLRQTGCDRGQGFLLARPLKDEELHRLLSTGHVLPQHLARTILRAA